MLQGRYLRQSTRKELAVLWLASDVRKQYRPTEEDRALGAQLKTVRIPSETGDLYRELKSRQAEKGFGIVPETLRKDVERYLSRRDIVDLRNLVKKYAQFRFERFIDLRSRQSYLLIRRAQGGLPVVVYLGARLPKKSYSFIREPLSSQAARHYIDVRATWWSIRDGP